MTTALQAHPPFPLPWNQSLHVAVSLPSSTCFTHSEGQVGFFRNQVRAHPLSNWKHVHTSPWPPCSAQPARAPSSDPSQCLRVPSHLVSLAFSTPEGLGFWTFAHFIFFSWNVLFFIPTHPLALSSDLASQTALTRAAPVEGVSFLQDPVTGAFDPCQRGKILTSYQSNCKWM